MKTYFTQLGGCVLFSLVFSGTMFAQVDIIQSNNILYVPSIGGYEFKVNETESQKWFSKDPSLSQELDGILFLKPYDGSAIYSPNILTVCVTDVDLNRIVIGRADLWEIISGDYSNYWIKQYGLGSGEVSFNSPRGITVDDNSIYVCDTGNNRLVKLNYDSNGNISHEWTVSSGLSSPWGVDIAPDGSVWVADRGNSIAHWRLM